MKRTVRSIIAVVMVLAFIFCFVACKEPDVWESATYTEDVELGSGAKTVTVEVKVKESVAADIYAGVLSPEKDPQIQAAVLALQEEK